MAVAVESEGKGSAFEATYNPPKGLIGPLAVVNHKTVALRYIVTALVFFSLAGVMALVMRVQLAHANGGLVSPETYNALFTMHGSTMMFFFAVPLIEGMANYLVPLMLGARDLAFPRFNAFNYWMYLAGGLFLYAGFFMSAVPDSGWFAYVPLTNSTFSPGLNVDLWLVGVTFAEISAIGAAMEFIVSILKLRAPGMSLDRMPIFVWSVLAASGMIVLAFTPLLVGSLFLETDRVLGTGFFEPALGGSPLLWQHLFWIFGHPEVYVMFLPAAGIVSQIVQAMTGQRLVGYSFVVAAIAAVSFLSMGLWVHHMFAVGFPLAPVAVFSAASLTIAIPNGVQVTAWIATLWRGVPRMSTAMLFVIGFIVIFALGGLTGIMIAVAPFDWQAHDSYFVVAHFHYVLIGGVVFPIFAALYHWFPKVRGRMLCERLGRWSFWLAFVGFNVTFLPMHLVGLFGMPRRVYTYPDGSGWGLLNLVSSIGSFVLAIGFLLTLLNLVRSFRGGVSAEANPWDADTLEWSIPSPPPAENFRQIPFVASRHPLWDGPQAEGAAWSAAMQQELAHNPTWFRSTVGTSPVDARPEELVHLPGPTIVPLVPAVGAAILSIGLLARASVGSAIGVAILFVGLGYWAWLNETERRDALKGYEGVAGLPLDASGPGSVAWWGLLIALVIGFVVFVTTLAAYFYLWSANEFWPPLRETGFPPSLLVPGVAAAVGLASVGTLTASARAFPSTRGTVWFVVTIGLGITSLTLWVIEWFRVPFTPTTDAQGSAFFAVVSASAFLFLIAVILGLALLIAVLRLPGAARIQTLLSNLRLIWVFGAASMFVAFIAVYTAPRW